MAKNKKTSSDSITHELGTFPYNQILARDSDNVRQVSMGNLEDLAKRIKAVGLLQPIGIYVIENPTSDDVSDEELEAMGLEEMPDKIGLLRYGFRRYYAIGLLREKNANFLTEVPVTFLATEDAEDTVTGIVQNIGENLDREQLTPGELAERFFLMEEAGMKHDEIAEKIGRSPGYVQTLIRLKKNLIDEAFEKFYEGDLTYDVSRAVLDAGRKAAKKAKEDGEDKETQDAAAAKAQKSSLARALKAIANNDEGSQKKRGAEAAATGEAGNPKPTKKVLNDKLEELKELIKEEKTPELKTAIAMLDWVLGNRTNSPIGSRLVRKAEKEEEKPAKKTKAVEKPAAKKAKAKPAKAEKPPKSAKKGNGDADDDEEEAPKKAKGKKAPPPKPKVGKNKKAA